MMTVRREGVGRSLISEGKGGNKGDSCGLSGARGRREGGGLY